MSQRNGIQYGLLLLAISGCYTASESSADTNTSWLTTCEQRSDCAEGFICMAGLCEPAVAEPEGEPGPASGPAHADEPEPGATSTGGTRATGSTLEPEPPFVLSEPERGIGDLPAVSWVQDHWVAAWGSWVTDDLPTPPGTYRGSFVELTHVSPEGSVQQRVLVESPGSRVPDYVFTEDGRLGVLHTHGGCSLDVYDVSHASPVAFGIPCGNDAHAAAAAPVPGSEDWLIVFGAGDLTGEYMLGRMSPALGDWVVEPFPLAVRQEYEALDVFASGDQAVVAWGNPSGTSLVVVPSMAAASGGSVPAGVTIRALGSGVVGSDADFSLAEQATPSPLVFGVDENVLWSAKVTPDDAAQPATRVVAEAGIADKRPGAAFIEPLGQTAVCYGTGTGPESGVGDRLDGVSLALVDAEGNAVGEPRVLAQGLHHMGGCALAWSGEALLVLWVEIEMGPVPAPSTLIRAQILRSR